MNETLSVEARFNKIAGWETPKKTVKLEVANKQLAQVRALYAQPIPKRSNFKLHLESGEIQVLSRSSCAPKRLRVVKQQPHWSILLQEKAITCPIFVVTRRYNNRRPSLLKRVFRLKKMCQLEAAPAEASVMTQIVDTVTAAIEKVDPKVAVLASTTIAGLIYSLVMCCKKDKSHIPYVVGFSVQIATMILTYYEIGVPDMTSLRAMIMDLISPPTPTLTIAEKYEKAINEATTPQKALAVIVSYSSVIQIQDEIEKWNRKNKGNEIPLLPTLPTTGVVSTLSQKMDPWRKYFTLQQTIALNPHVDEHLISAAWNIKFSYVKEEERPDNDVDDGDARPEYNDATFKKIMHVYIQTFKKTPEAIASAFDHFTQEKPMEGSISLIDMTTLTPNDFHALHQKLIHLIPELAPTIEQYLCDEQNVRPIDKFWHLVRDDTEVSFATAVRSYKYRKNSPMITKIQMIDLTPIEKSLVNIISSKSTEEQREKIPKIKVQEESYMDMIKTVVTKLFTWISTYLFASMTDLVPTASVSAAVKKIKDFSYLEKEMESGLSGIAEFFGYETEFSKGLKVLKGLNTTANEYLQIPPHEYLQDKIKFYELKKFVLDLEAVVQKNHSEAQMKAAHDILKGTYVAIQKMYNDLCNTHSDCTTRFDPLCVLIYGKGGIGKTRLMGNLANKQKFTNERENETYTISKSNYWMEYAGQRVGVYDEAFTGNDFKDDRFAMDFRTICSSAAYNMEGAAIQHKHQPCNFEIIFCTTNTTPKEIKARLAYQSEESQAYFSRMMIIEAIYNHPKSDNQAREDLRVDESGNFNHLKFKEWKSTTSKVDFTHLKDMNYRELTEAINTRMEKKRVAYAGMIADNARIREEKKQPESASSRDHLVINFNGPPGSGKSHMLESMFDVIRSTYKMNIITDVDFNKTYYKKSVFVLDDKLLQDKSGYITNEEEYMNWYNTKCPSNSIIIILTNITPKSNWVYVGRHMKLHNIGIVRRMGYQGIVNSQPQNHIGLEFSFNNRVCTAFGDDLHLSMQDTLTKIMEGYASFLEARSDFVIEEVDFVTPRPETTFILEATSTTGVQKLSSAMSAYSYVFSSREKFEALSKNPIRVFIDSSIAGPLARCNLTLKKNKLSHDDCLELCKQYVRTFKENNVEPQFYVSFDDLGSYSYFQGKVQYTMACNMPSVSFKILSPTEVQVTVIQNGDEFKKIFSFKDLEMFAAGDEIPKHLLAIPSTILTAVRKAFSLEALESTPIGRLARTWIMDSLERKAKREREIYVAQKWLEFRSSKAFTWTIIAGAVVATLGLVWGLKKVFFSDDEEINPDHNEILVAWREHVTSKPIELATIDELCVYYFSELNNKSLIEELIRRQKEDPEEDYSALFGAGICKLAINGGFMPPYGTHESPRKRVIAFSRIMRQAKSSEAKKGKIGTRRPVPVQKLDDYDNEEEPEDFKPTKKIVEVPTTTKYSNWADEVDDVLFFEMKKAHQESIVKCEPMNSSAFPRTIVDLNKKYQKNHCHVKVVMSDENEIDIEKFETIGSCYGLGIRGRTVLSVGHMVALMKATKGASMYVMRDEWGPKAHKASLIQVSEKLDVSYLYVPNKKLSSFANIEKSFISADDVKSYTGTIFQRYDDKNKEEWFCGTMIYYPNEIEVELVDGEVIKRQQMFEINYGNITNPLTDRGDCALPYISMAKEQAGKILGIHTMSQRTNYAAYATLVTKEDVMAVKEPKLLTESLSYENEFLTPFSFDEKSVVQVPSDVAGLLASSVQQLTELRVLHDIPFQGTPQVQVLGSFRGNQSVLPANDIKPTPWSKKLRVPNLKRPVNFDYDKTPEDQKKHFTINNYRMPCQRSTQELMWEEHFECSWLTPERKEYIVSQFANRLRLYAAARPLTNYEVINGLKDHKWADALSSMTLDTSIGWTMSKLFFVQKKCDVLTKSVQGIVTWKKTEAAAYLQKYFAESCKAIERGDTVFTCFKDAMKNEKLLNEKYCKARLFCASDILGVLLERKYMGCLIAGGIKEQKGCGIGTDPLADFNALAQRLNKFKAVFGGDFSRFDKRMRTQLFDIFEAALIQVLRTESQLAEDALEKFINGIKHSLKSVCHSYHVSGHTLFQKHQGMPSGALVTSWLDSELVELMFYIAFVQIAEDNQLDSTFANFDALVVQERLGDDSITSVSEDIKEIYNLETISKFLEKEFGIILESEQKNGQTYKFMKLDQLGFISRSFRKLDNHPFVIGALKKESISSLLHWTISKDTFHLASLINQAIIESALWENDYFNFIQKDIQTITNVRPDLKPLLISASRLAIQYDVYVAGYSSIFIPDPRENSLNKITQESIKKINSQFKVVKQALKSTKILTNENMTDQDYKSILNLKFQQGEITKPVYTVTDGDLSRFHATVTFSVSADCRRVEAHGNASTKRGAEQLAALAALNMLTPVCARLQGKVRLEMDTQTRTAAKPGGNAQTSSVGAGSTGNAAPTDGVLPGETLVSPSGMLLNDGTVMSAEGGMGAVVDLNATACALSDPAASGAAFDLKDQVYGRYRPVKHVSVDATAAIGTEVLRISIDPKTYPDTIKQWTDSHACAVLATDNVLQIQGATGTIGLLQVSWVRNINQATWTQDELSAINYDVIDLQFTKTLNFSMRDVRKGDWYRDLINPDPTMPFPGVVVTVASTVSNVNRNDAISIPIVVYMKLNADARFFNPIKNRGGDIPVDPSFPLSAFFTTDIDILVNSNVALTIEEDNDVDVYPDYGYLTRDFKPVFNASCAIDVKYVGHTFTNPIVCFAEKHFALRNETIPYYAQAEKVGIPFLMEYKMAYGHIPKNPKSYSDIMLPTWTMVLANRQMQGSHEGRGIKYHCTTARVYPAGIVFHFEKEQTEFTVEETSCQNGPVDAFTEQGVDLDYIPFKENTLLSDGKVVIQAIAPGAFTNIYFADPAKSEAHFPGVFVKDLGLQFNAIYQSSTGTSENLGAAFRAVNILRPGSTNNTDLTTIVSTYSPEYTKFEKVCKAFLEKNATNATDLIQFEVVAHGQVLATLGWFGSLFMRTTGTKKLLTNISLDNTEFINFKVIPNLDALPATNTDVWTDWHTSGKISHSRYRFNNLRLEMMAIAGGLMGGIGQGLGQLAEMQQQTDMQERDLKMKSLLNQRNNATNTQISAAKTAGQLRLDNQQYRNNVSLMGLRSKSAQASTAPVQPTTVITEADVHAEPSQGNE